jgi:hypothetical protein
MERRTQVVSHLCASVSLWLKDLLGFGPIGGTMTIAKNKPRWGNCVKLLGRLALVVVLCLGCRAASSLYWRARVRFVSSFLAVLRLFLAGVYLLFRHLSLQVVMGRRSALRKRASAHGHHPARRVRSQVGNAILGPQAAKPAASETTGSFAPLPRLPTISPVAWSRCNGCRCPFHNILIS